MHIVDRRYLNTYLILKKVSGAITGPWFNAYYRQKIPKHIFNVIYSRGAITEP